MRRIVVFAAIAAVGLALAARRSSAALAPSGEGAWSGALLDAADDAVYSIAGVHVVSDRWSRDAAKPQNASLVALLRAAEDRYAIPRDLLVRLAWQESRFNVAAHNAASNATGIMQIVPRWHPGVDPLDPPAAIDYGARYLADQWHRFGSWELALKAYNWGPGNVNKWLASGGASPPEPLETQNYSAQILADVREAGSVIA
jgi:soluble lytic murein transglycosylase-like protein